MRRGFNQTLFYGKHKRFVGMALGSDATTEHEIGIRSLQTALGLDLQAAPGVERRRVTRVDPRRLRLLEGSDATYLLYLPQDWTRDKSDEKWLQMVPRSDLTPRGDETFVGAWDEASFGAAARGAVRAQLRELHAALLAGDVALGGEYGEAFAGSGLRLLIISRLPYHALKIAADTDRQRDAERATLQRYCQEIDFEGLKAALRRAGRGWFALTPRVMTDGSVWFWLNPEDQQRNRAGWYSVKALRQWITGDGPIPMR